MYQQDLLTEDEHAPYKLAFQFNFLVGRAGRESQKKEPALCVGQLYVAVTDKSMATTRRTQSLGLLTVQGTNTMFRTDKGLHLVKKINDSF